MKEYAKDFYKSAAWKRARQTVIKRVASAMDMLPEQKGQEHGNGN